MKFFRRFILSSIISLFFLVSPAYAQQATLSLSPATGTFNQNCPFALDVNLDTGGAQVDGVDVILLYDTSRVNATSINNGNIFADYVGSNIDNNTGKVTVSGLASISSPFSGQGKVATVNFTVNPSAPTGLTQIKFDFDPSTTTKSNVVQRGTVANILSSVNNGSYTVGTGACGTTGAAASAGNNVGGPVGQGTISTPSAQQQTGYQQPTTRKTLPYTGTEQLTYTIAIVGSVLTVLGILGLVAL